MAFPAAPKDCSLYKPMVVTPMTTMMPPSLANQLVPRASSRAEIAFMRSRMVGRGAGGRRGENGGGGETRAAAGGGSAAGGGGGRRSGLSFGRRSLWRGGERCGVDGFWFGGLGLNRHGWG